MKWPLLNKIPNYPALDSPAAFAHKRSYYYHPGIDLYCRDGQPIVAIEDGVIVNIEMFTGPDADPPSPWWNETWSVMVEGASGALGYCEICFNPEFYLGQNLKEGDLIGFAIPVLKKDKGNGTTMLHFEMYKSGTRSHVTWHHGEEKPDSLLDPTEFLSRII